MQDRYAMMVVVFDARLVQVGMVSAAMVPSAVTRSVDHGHDQHERLEGQDTG